MTHNESSIQTWESVFASRPWGRYPCEELVRFVSRNFAGVPDRAQVRLLDFGCGPGRNVWFMAREGFSVAGIDGSPTAIRQAVDRLAADGLPSVPPRVDLRCGNFCSLPWDDASFDGVVEAEALCANSLAIIRECLAEIHRVLKPGGLFFGRMFGDETTGAYTGEQIEPGTSANPLTGPCAGYGVIHFFKQTEFEELFSKFELVSIETLSRTDKGTKLFEWLVTARKL